MYRSAYGMGNPLNMGMEPNSYTNVVSFYDSYDSIPLPFISCACSPVYEMLWCTTQNGFLKGYDTMTNQLRCSVEVTQNRYIYSLQSTPIGQLTVSDYGMNIYNHGGLLRAKIGYELEESGLFRAGHCYIDAGSQVLSLVGEFDGLYTFDLLSSKKKKRAFSDKGCCIYSNIHGSLIGTSTGSIIMMDPRMNKYVNSINAFLLTTQHVLRLGNYIVTVGVDYVSKKNPQMPNTSVKVFDARTFDILNYTHRFMPCVNSLTMFDESADQFLLSDYSGNCSVYSLANGLNELHQFAFNNMNNEIITSSTVSSTKNVVFGVSYMGGIHSNSNCMNWKINYDSKLYPTPILRRPFPVNIDYSGTGAYQPRHLQTMSANQILSQDLTRSSSLDTFTNCVVDLPKTRRIIDPSLIEEYPKSEYIRGIIKLNKRITPNSLLYSQQKDSIFLQVDPRKQSRRSIGDVAEEDLESNIPSGYRYKEMRLNHYGFYDIDFGQFNKTFFVGLENNIPNSFLNGMIFLLWSMSSLKELILSHTCSTPLCITCELKFLFRMFDQGLETRQEGIVVHATNFYRVVEHNQLSVAFGLLDDPEGTPSLRAERFLRFVISQIMNELDSSITYKKKNAPTSLSSSLTNLFSVASVQTHRCVKGHMLTKPSSTFVVDVECSSKSSFISSLENELNGTKKNALWCDQCKDATCESEKTILSLPQSLIVVINQSIPESDQNWNQDDSFFIPSFSIALEKDSNGKVVISPTSNQGMKYQLKSVVSLINDELGCHSPTPTPVVINTQHLVLHSVVQEPDKPAGWYLFNDFSICSSSEQDALTFTQPWKTPICFVYENIDYDTEVIPSLLNASLHPSQPFYTPTSLGAPNIPLSFRPLPLDQLPGKGELISIDCEFIALNCEEAEILPDGHRIVRKEADLRLGRVTCLTQDLQVFIDDYILCEDPVADYLTRFSGLSREDLELHKSKHHLVELKESYVRLRSLVDRGCIFVGHGLQKDFHTINIFVPPNQIIDTVNIYHFPKHRKLSLKYLAKVVLNINIQEGNHDSNEDARTALELYYKYLDLKKEGKWDETLSKVYELGKQCNFYGYSTATSPPPIE